MLPPSLPDDPAVLRHLLLAAGAEIERLRLQIAGLQRNRFGRRSERLDEQSLQQGLADLEQSVAEQAARLEVGAVGAAPPRASEPPPPRHEPAQRPRGGLPAHLPRVEVIVDLDDKTCPRCGGSRHRIGADRAEMLDDVPAQFRVRMICRPRYGCRSCTDGVMQAPAPERPSDGGMATEALLAHVLINKYSDYLPLYRHSQIFARQGIALDRSTWGNWL